MHKLLLQFEPVTNKQAIDALVHALVIELFVDSKIEASHSAYNILEFESAAHCTLAQLKLAGNSRYTVTRL
mgnify:CR=1 FL=1